MKSITCKCPLCGESGGSIEITPALAVAVEALNKLKKPATREDIHDRSDLKTRGGLSGTYHRVNRLLEMGVVKRVGTDRPELFALV